MSLKSSLLKWLQSSSQRKHRASDVEDAGSKGEAPKKATETEPEKKVPSSPEKAEVHQDPYES